VLALSLQIEPGPLLRQARATILSDGTGSLP
jgi:hypothetical protein